MSKKVAIIDLGSNTFHLSIKGIDANGDGYDLFSKQCHVQLAEGGLKNKRILKGAYIRAIRAFKEFKSLTDELGVDEIIAFATSVFRDAENIQSLIDEGCKILDAKIEIIDGSREAELIFAGVVNAYKPNGKPYLIVDIGGGSVEFIIAKKKQILWVESLPIGGLRLSKDFQQNAPMTRVEINELQSFLNFQLENLKQAIDEFKPKVLVGAAGSFETLSKIEYINFKNKSFPEFEKANRIDMDTFYQMAEIISKSDKIELFEIPGMDDFRAELMPVSVVLIEKVLSLGHFKEIWYSDYAMKEGIFFEYLETRKL